MKTLEIELPWPHRGLSPNSRLQLLAKARLFKAVKNQSYLITRAALGRRKIRLKAGSRMNLRMVLTPPILRYRDEDNLIANCKAVFDGISQALGINDHLFHFREQEWLETDPGKKGKLKIVLDWDEDDKAE